MNEIQVFEALESLRVITNETHMIVIGTQSLHGTHPNAPDEIMHSREVDVILKHKASLANWISDVVGDETPFEVERGYFIDHVRPKPGLPILAEGWEYRMTRSTAVRGCMIDFLSPPDLAIAKLGAKRDKDLPFIAGMVERKILSLKDIKSLIPFVQIEYRQTVEIYFDKLVLLLEQNEALREYPQLTFR